MTVVEETYDFLVNFLNSKNCLTEFTTELYKAHKLTILEHVSDAIEREDFCKKNLIISAFNFSFTEKSWGYWIVMHHAYENMCNAVKDKNYISPGHKSITYYKSIW